MIKQRRELAARRVRELFLAGRVELQEFGDLVDDVDAQLGDLDNRIAQLEPETAVSMLESLSEVAPPSNLASSLQVGWRCGAS